MPRRKIVLPESFPARNKARDFADTLNAAFALRDELKLFPKMTPLYVAAKMLATGG